MNRGSDSRSWYKEQVNRQERAFCAFSGERGSGELTYLSDVDKSTHEVLVAEGVDRLLGLFSSSVFHNPGFCQPPDGF